MAEEDCLFWQLYKLGFDSTGGSLLQKLVTFRDRDEPVLLASRRVLLQEGGEGAGHDEGVVGAAICGGDAASHIGGVDVVLEQRGLVQLA